MSTVPGPGSWRDAGLAPVDDAQPLGLADLGAADVPDAQDAEEHAPAPARADLDGRADEADVVEQALEVPLDDDDEEGPGA